MPFFLHLYRNRKLPIKFFWTQKFGDLPLPIIPNLRQCPSSPEKMSIAWMNFISILIQMHICQLIGKRVQILKERNEENKKKTTEETTLPWPPGTKTINIGKDYLSKVIQPILDFILSYLSLSEKLSFGSVNKTHRNNLLKYLVKSTESVKLLSCNVQLSYFAAFEGNRLVRGKKYLIASHSSS